MQIGDFSSYYRTTLSEPIKIDSQNALASSQSLLNAVRQAGHTLYLLIDEYDNFANELMMGHRSAEESRYQAISSGEGYMKAMFKTIKAAASGQGLGQVFITGVSPVAMSDLTSAYNVAENIYLLPQFNTSAASGKRRSPWLCRGSPGSAICPNPMRRKRLP